MESGLRFDVLKLAQRSKRGLHGLGMAAIAFQADQQVIGAKQ